MKTTEICREVTIDGIKIPVSIGDTVWWFMENQLNNIPAVAIVIQFSEDNMIDLARYTSPGSRLTAEVGVCLLDDPRLSNANYRKRGSWCPRGMWSSLNLK
jgi:hypothetical protein